MSTSKDAIQPLGWQGYFERFAAPILQRDRFFLALVMALAVMLAEAVALVSLVPLHQKVPYIVTVNQRGQVVGAGKLTIIQGKPTGAELTYWLGRWARDLYAVDPVLSRRNLQQAYLMTHGVAVGEISRYFKSDNSPLQQLHSNPAMRVKAQVEQVRVIGQNEVYVVLTTTNELTGATTERDLTIDYRLKPPKTTAGALANPLGLQITSFSTGDNA